MTKYVDFVWAKSDTDLVEKINEKLKDPKWDLVQLDFSHGFHRAWMKFEDDE